MINVMREGGKLKNSKIIFILALVLVFVFVLFACKKKDTLTQPNIINSPTLSPTISETSTITGTITPTFTITPTSTITPTFTPIYPVLSLKRIKTVFFAPILVI